MHIKRQYNFCIAYTQMLIPISIELERKMRYNKTDTYTAIHRLSTIFYN